MVGTFAQVWFLCAIAFLAGSAVTWLLFVRGRPRHPAHPLYRAAPRPAQHRAATSPRPDPVAPPEAPPPAEPALANLDTHRSDHTTRRPGSSAAGALDRLGVAGGAQLPAPPPSVEVPAQGGPVDGTAPDDRR
jgi:hypothetical protein